MLFHSSEGTVFVHAAVIDVILQKLGGSSPRGVQGTSSKRSICRLHVESSWNERNLQPRYTNHPPSQVNPHPAGNTVMFVNGD